MLRITIEMLKGGNPREVKVLYVGTITLVKMNKSKSRGTYRVELDDKGGRPWKQGIVENFPRKKLLAWDLLQRGLAAVLGGDRT